MAANGHLSVAEGCCRPQKAAKTKTDIGLLPHRQPPLHLYCHLKRQFVLCITYGQLCIVYGQLCYMYIQLCKIDDCHGNDYDAFGKRRDRHRELLRPLRAAVGRASRDAHRTVSMSLPDGVDVSVGRCRCRYRTVCMGNDGRRDGNGGLRMGNGGLRDGGGLTRGGGEDSRGG